MSKISRRSLIASAARCRRSLCLHYALPAIVESTAVAVAAPTISPAAEAQSKGPRPEHSPNE